jgi:hypothetical protein
LFFPYSSKGKHLFNSSKNIPFLIIRMLAF